VSTQAANQTVTGTAIDRAGNVTQTTTTINLDKTKPTITATVSPAPNAAGWNGRANVSPTDIGNVTVSFTCADPGPSGIGVGSGVATCSSPVTVSTNTLGQVVTGTVVDLAGNTQTTQVTVKIDRTIPTVSNVSVNPGVIVFNPLVSITATAADPSGNGNVASGVIGGEYFIDTDPGEGNGNAMTYSGGQLSASTHITGLNVGPHTLYVRSLDAAGNWSLKSSTGFVFVF